MKKPLSNKSKRIIKGYFRDIVIRCNNWIDDFKVSFTETELKEWFITVLNSNTNRFSKSKIELYYKVYITTKNKTFFKIKVIVDGNSFNSQVELYKTESVEIPINNIREYLTAYIWKNTTAKIRYTRREKI